MWLWGNYSKQLLKLTEEQKKELVKPQSSLMTALKSGEAIASLTDKVLNLAGHPLIQGIIKSLLGS
jgi:hypothetical protein